MQLRGDDLLRLLNCGATLDMNSEDGVGTRRVHIEAVVSCSSLLLALEETVKGFLLVAALSHRQTTYLNLAIGIVLHSDV